MQNKYKVFTKKPGISEKYYIETIKSKILVREMRFERMNSYETRL